MNGDTRSKRKGIGIRGISWCRPPVPGPRETMEITNYQNLVGYSWYAADSNGHIAIFSNAGVGEIPVYLRQDKDKYEEIISAWDDYVEKHLPIRGRAHVGIISPEVLTAIDRRSLTLEEYGGDARRDAERGFFVYDAELNHRSPSYSKFLRLFVPENPLHLNEVDERMKNKLLALKRPMLFAEKDVFSSEEIVSLFSTAA